MKSKLKSLIPKEVKIGYSGTTAKPYGYAKWRSSSRRQKRR